MSSDNDYDQISPDLQTIFYILLFPGCKLVEFKINQTMDRLIYQNLQLKIIIYLTFIPKYFCAILLFLDYYF